MKAVYSFEISVPFLFISAFILMWLYKGPDRNIRTFFCQQSICLIQTIVF